MEIEAFYNISYGVYLLGSGESGCVINTLVQVSSNPALVTVSVNKKNHTHKTIQKNKYFNVLPVTQNISMDVIKTFGFSTSENVNKYEKFKTEKDGHNSLYVSENVAAIFECEVINEVELETHTIFIAKVVNSKVLSKEPVMTYEYYQKNKKGLTPPKAPSYKEKQGYVCPICGYVHDEKPEENFVCPICKAPGSIFRKQES